MNRFSAHFRKFAQAGQTSTEYILLIGAVAVMIFSLMGQLQEWMVGEGENCDVNPDAFVCTITNHLPRRGYQNYRYFQFR